MSTLGSAAMMAVALATIGAAPDDNANAKVLFEEGVALAKTEQWSAALEKFEASRALVERPSTLFNIGTALLRLHRPTAAIQTFEQFLAVSDQAAKSKAAQGLITEARASLARVEVTIEPSDAALSVDGEPIATGGAVRLLELDPGTRVFEVSAEGYVAVRETLALDAGASLSRTIALESAPAEALPPPPPAPPLVAVAPPVVVAPPPETEITATAPIEDESFVESPWFWVIAGAVVVGAAVGIGFAAAGRGVEDPTGGDTGDVLHP